MPLSRKSSTTSGPKPVNIFYVWYAELCRRANTAPLAIVKPAKPKNNSVLDFVSDRIKAEEWVPIVKALSQDTSLHVIAIRSKIDCKFLYEVNTEEKVKCTKRKFGSVWTAYVLNSLVRSLTGCISRSNVLTCLELDGLPIMTEYLQLLINGLLNNRTIRILSLKHCPIRDAGCQQLCDSLRFMPNVEVLNLSSCRLTSQSAEHIAKVIRSQQINRYTESWHKSLRYEDPDVGDMAGLKRITLNNNPLIGNEGLLVILNELDDDLWIKALDMQRCSITETIANRLVDVIDYSRSLEIADFRNNDQLSEATIQKILTILINKQKFGYECEYKWCFSSTTLPYDVSIYDLLSNSCVSSNIQKSKSAPFKQTQEKHSTSEVCKLRRTKTSGNFTRKKPELSKSDSSEQLSLAKKEVVDLNMQLQQEIAKRVEAEKRNEKLGKKLSQIKAVTKLVKNTGRNGEKVSDVEKILKALTSIQTESETGEPEKNDKKELLEIKIATLAKQEGKPTNVASSSKNPSRNGYVQCSNGMMKSVEFVFPSNGVRLAQNLFENLMSKSQQECEESEEENTLSYYQGGSGDKNKPPAPNKGEPQALQNDDSSSNESLLDYLKEIRADKDGFPDRNIATDTKIPAERNTSREKHNVNKNIYGDKTKLVDKSNPRDNNNNPRGKTNPTEKNNPGDKGKGPMNGYHKVNGLRKSSRTVVNHLDKR